MPRSVKEWRSDNPDSMPPPRVRLRIFTAYRGICQLTGREIRPGDRWDLDHKKALANGGANSENNLWPVLAEAHKGKTREDRREKAHVEKRIKSHFGIGKSLSKLSGASRAEKNAKLEARAAAKGPRPARRSIYTEA